MRRCAVLPEGFARGKYGPLLTALFRFDDAVEHAEKGGADVYSAGRISACDVSNERRVASGRGFGVYSFGRGLVRYLKHPNDTR